MSTLGKVVKISSQRLTSATNTVTFSSIPGTYSHLMLFVSVRFTGTSGTEVRMTLNGQTSAYYSLSWRSKNSLQDSSTNNNLAYFRLESAPQSTAGTGHFQFGWLRFLNYSRTSVRKQYDGRWAKGTSNGGNMFAEVYGQHNTLDAAITSIGFTTNADNFAIDSEFTLYGLGY